jgi:L-lactate dehydrogenase complex protein LldF
MPVDIHAPYKERVRQSLDEPFLQMAVERSTTRMVAARHAAMTAVDGEKLRNQARQMKEYVLRHLPDLLEQLEANLKANGGIVHWAKDAEEANRIVREIALQNGVRKVVKSKSMATEEIHLNKALEETDIQVVETDLGEYIIQLANEPPSHILAPVIHKRVEDISELFHEKLDIPRTLEPEALCTAARYALRREFLSADMGISGCNFAIAETGTICIVTNEGNGRMVSSMPRVYVAVMGIEKLVPTVEDAMLQLQVLCRSATGQAFSVYCSMTSGPRRPGHPDGPEQFHVVLLDNGRTRMLAEGYGEALLCLRCGACLNICPVYRSIGGHAYGSTYSGPIGAVITPLLADRKKQFKELPHASTLCGACRDVCPVKIDLPRLLVDLRADLVDENAAPLGEQLGIKAFVKAASTRENFERAGKFASISTNFMANMSGGNIHFLPPPLSGWTQSRDFPAFARISFREWWQERMALRQRD